MPLPNSAIASAFIESYLNTRKDYWKLEIKEGEAIKIPADETVKHKLTICLSILKSLKNAKTFEDWINVLDEMYEKERAEFDAHQNRYALTRLVTSQPLAGDMLHADRSYIISELKSEPAFKELIDTLTAQKIALNEAIWVAKNARTPQVVIDAKQIEFNGINKKLEARKDDDTYYLTFLAAKKLSEKTIDDFKTRNLVISQRLLDEDSAKKTTEAQTVSPSETKAQPEVVTAVIKDKKDDAPVVAVTPSTSKIPPPPPPSIIAVPSVAEHKAPTSPSALREFSTFPKPSQPIRIQPPRNLKIARIPMTATVQNSEALTNKRPR